MRFVPPELAGARVCVRAGKQLYQVEAEILYGDKRTNFLSQRDVAGEWHLSAVCEYARDFLFVEISDL